MTKQTDTSAEAVGKICINLCHPKAAFRPSISDARKAADLIRALAAERDECKARADLATPKVKRLVWNKSHISGWNDDWHTVPTGYTVRCADENGWKWATPLGAFGYEPSAEAAKAAAQADYERRILEALEPTTTLADAYRAGLEAAAKRHVYYAHQYERIGAIADAEAHMEHARQIRALPVPTEFGETNDQ